VVVHCCPLAGVDPVNDSPLFPNESQCLHGQGHWPWALNTHTHTHTHFKIWFISKIFVVVVVKMLYKTNTMKKMSGCHTSLVHPEWKKKNHHNSLLSSYLYKHDLLPSLKPKTKWQTQCKRLTGTFRPPMKVYGESSSCQSAQHRCFTKRKNRGLEVEQFQMNKWLTVFSFLGELLR